MNEHLELRRRHALRSWRAVLVAATILVSAVACQEVTQVPGPVPDDGPPDVNITSPLSGTTVDVSRIDVEGNAIDQDGIYQVTVANVTGDYAGPCDDVGSDFLCTGVSLTEGMNRLEVTAWDNDGNEARDDVTVTYEPDGGANGDGPTFSDLSPADGTTTSTAFIDVTGNVSDDDDVSDVTVSNDDAGHSAPCALSGTAFECSDVPLAEGVNTVVLTATDTKGDSSERSLTVTYDPNDGNGDDTPPTITNVSPSDGATVTDQSIDVTGDVSDDGTVANVTLDNLTADTQYTCNVGPGTFGCSDVFLHAGTNELQIQANDSAGNTATRTITLTYDPPTTSDDFDIELVVFDSDFTRSQRAALDEAVSRWESIVTGDLQDMAHDKAAGESCPSMNLGEPAYQGTVDDLLMFATTLSGQGDTIAIAGPCLSRSSGPDDGTNYVGILAVNSDHLDSLEEDGDLVETLVHEIGHVLGFGTNWEFGPFALLDYEPSDRESCETVSSFTQLPVYTGAQGVSAYHHLGASGDIPVEADGPLGTRCGHWDDDTFGSELMTGFLNHGQHNPLSEMSIASFEDIGLEVDRSKAEPYDMALATQSTRDQGIDLASREILLRPIGSVDVETGEFTPAPPR